MSLESDLAYFLAWFVGISVPGWLAVWAYETWAARRPPERDLPPAE